MGFLGCPQGYCQAKQEKSFDNFRKLTFAIVVGTNQSYQIPLYTVIQVYTFITFLKTNPPYTFNQDYTFIRNGRVYKKLIPQRCVKV